MKNSMHKRQAKEVDNSGFSPNSAAEGSRLLNKDGSTNLRKVGMGILQRYSVFHTLLRMSGTTFLFLVFLFYTTTNILFAFIYLALGIENLHGVDVSTNFITNFTQAFFFSSQTMTTVGYGHVAPSGFIANAIASIESFLGIITFALVTGMFYARFSRPKAYIKFSENFLIAPYKEGRAIMFRLATYKNNDLTEVNAEVTAAIHHMEDGKRISKFYPVPLEISRINSLALSWTCVHYITEDSPFWLMTEQELRESKVELMVTIKGFDDHYSNTVQQRTSYNHAEMVYGAKFESMYHRSETNNITEVNLNKVNAHVPFTFANDLETA
ncbi:Inward rectifier potassium channel Irk [Taibaiella lutea]|uniref:Inward rectifier potassium channel Irk n=1 Tax=Taibaiella lutea TaxID=2608001 RepID=A0A5M6CIX8_9BACT|nr:ion channel [Taibaiella lutea]KAA5534976.1 Inward rectifier potassium channel Irk [Taibaiella lutea]